MTADPIELRRLFDDRHRGDDGTRLGCSAAMLSTTPRQRDRRQGVPELLAALTRALDRRQDIALMRGVFEQTLRQLLPLRTVQLREASSRWLTRPETVVGPESIALRVAGADAAAAGVLEATFDPGCRLG